MKAIVRRPLYEAGVTYGVGDAILLPAPRAFRLAELGLVEIVETGEMEAPISGVSLDPAQPTTPLDRAMPSPQAGRRRGKPRKPDA